MNTILIDADGCPVVDIAAAIAYEKKWECIIVCDTSHYFEKRGATTLTVSKGPDSVDFQLVNMILKGDIVVTQDYGLAAMCLAKQAIPVNQDGMVYDCSNIDSLLMARHTARKIRNSGGRLKGKRKRNESDNISFRETLYLLIEQAKQTEIRG